MKVCVEDDLAPKVGVRLSGTGGQGLVLAGRLLAEAAAIHCGLNVVFTKSYGPEARGGASRSDVVLSPGEVDDLVSDPVDLLVCLSQQACDRYFPNLAYRGFLLVDSTNVTVVPTNRAVELPLSETASRKCGGKMVTNVLALSAMCALTDIVTRGALRKAVGTMVREEFLEQNLKAMDFGYRLAVEHLKKMSPRRRKELPELTCLREAAGGAGSGKRALPLIKG
jgi:2-oxoglutarate ferredoxin oxidoreductase subunit gamma